MIGAELEAKWTPTENLFIQLGVGLLDTEIKDAGTLITAVEGAPLSNAPELSMSGLIVQSINVGDRLLSLQTDFRWVDEQNAEKANDPKNLIESSFVINARVSMPFGQQDQFEAAIWAENITEEKTCLNLDDNGALNYQVQCTPNDGMAFYGVNLRYNF